MIYLGNSAEIEDIKKKYIAFLEKLKPYFEKYGYTYKQVGYDLYLEKVEK